MDKDSGLVHHLKVTGANEHDVTATPDLMHGEEKELYGDSGYIGAEKRENAAKKSEHKKSSVRAKAEHVLVSENTIQRSAKTDRQIEYYVCPDKPLSG